MNCQQAQHQLRTTVDFISTVPEGALLAHLQQCQQCREVAEDQRLQALLQSLPVPPPSPGFAERVLTEAWQHSDQGRRDPGTAIIKARWPVAAAASLVAAVVGLTLVLNQQPMPIGGDRVVSNSVAPSEDAGSEAAFAQVDMLLISGTSYPRANITLRLDENISLQGRPGQRSLRWQAHIAAGNNQLSLPLTLEGADSGKVSVEVESNGVRKIATFTVSSGGDGVATNKLAARLRQTIFNEV